ncbi:MAG: radical SAM protein [Chloroflexi bacterium]|nr:radical SAM protein [Chloroflexota bacterium]
MRSFKTGRGMFVPRPRLIEPEAPNCYPRYAVWEITLNCNLRCIHCGSAAERNRYRPEELDTDEILDLCDQLAAMGNRRVTISGGEPFLRKDWSLVVERLQQYGIEVGIISNGYLIPDIIDEIARFPGLDIIGISLDGTEKTHDRIRGIKGSFQRTITAFELLKRRGLRTAAVTSVCKLNIGELEDIYRILVSSGLYAWQLQLIFVGGRMRKNSELVCPPEDLPRILDFIAEKRESGTPMIIYPADCLGYFTWREEKIRPSSWPGCHAGILGIGIESNGNIKGCLSLTPEFLENNPFVEGNIRENTLKEIWNRPGAFAYNRNFDKRKAKAGCRCCIHLSKCRCGCSATAYYATGSRYDNPYCVYRVED